MNVQLDELRLDFKRTTEVIPFKHFTYFYGQMGAGKSSIARLIDYCLGGDLDYTPALQAEFISVTLLLHVEGIALLLMRERESNQVRAQWNNPDGFFDVVLPARTAKGEVLPGTEVEVLSDLFFYLAGSRPPRVRRSKVNEDSELARLSFRDLWWYCYLDQEEIDSNLFHLDRTANNFKRFKSRDVLRFVLGYHQEKVAELEAQLESVRMHRAALLESARTLKEALAGADVGSTEDIETISRHLGDELQAVETDILALRSNISALRGHAVDTLRVRGRHIAYELASLETAITDLDDVIGDEQRYSYELKTLSVKAHRDAAARAVLGGVDFLACPRCAQALPQRQADHCPVCDQPEAVIQLGGVDADALTEDVQARQRELDELLEQHRAQQKVLRSRLTAYREEKGRVDAELNAALNRYDSEYLSSALELERRKATLNQRVTEYERLARLPRLVDEQSRRADILAADEEGLKRELAEARQEAERDTKNLHHLENLFLDCLVRAKVPGFAREDKVTISAPYFLPEVASAESGNLIVNSFANLGSGGKKTLYKACFAIALHRLAIKVGGLLPTILIIDSPMKNISERENRVQFEGFHTLLYELASDELAQTQFILIDKEYLPGPKELAGETYIRHMAPNEMAGQAPEDVPLIPYFGLNNLPDGS